MPKIKLPEERANTANARLDTNVPIGGALMIAEKQKEAGKQIAAMGKQYFNIAAESISDALYNNNISQATLEFSQQYNERISKKVDDKGNPTYTTLESDIDKIADNVQMKYGMLGDVNAKNKFSKTFGDLYVNKKLQASKEARNQHMDYSKAVLGKSINNFMEAAVKDNGNNVDLYNANIDQLVNDSIKNGILSVDQAAQLKNQSQNKLNRIKTDSTVGNLDAAIQSKDETVIQGLINGTAEDFGLPHTSFKGLRSLAKTKQKEINDDKLEIAVSSLKDKLEANPDLAIGFTEMSEEEAIAAGFNPDLKKDLNKFADSWYRNYIKDEINRTKEEEKAIKNAQHDATTALKLANVEGKLTSADVYEAAAAKKINPDQQLELLGALKKQEKVEARQSVVNQEIDTAIQRGDSLTQNFSDKDLQRKLNEEAIRIAGVDEQGKPKPPQLNDLIQASASYNVPFKELNNRLGNTIKYSTNSKEVDQVIQAYDSIKQTNPITLESMSTKDIAALELTRDMIVMGGMKHDEALQHSRKLIYDTKDSDIEARKIKFNKEPAFKPTDIDNTIKDIFGLDSTLGFGGKDLSPVAKDYLKEALKDAYVNGDGNPETAKKTVAAKNARLFGVSEMNETPGYIDDTEQFEYLPIEQQYPAIYQKYGIDAFKEQLRTDWATDLPEGVPVENLRIRGDDLSRTPNNPASWRVTYVDPTTGIEVPLVDKKDPRKLARFKFDPKQYEEQRDRSKQTNFEAIANTARMLD